MLTLKLKDSCKVNIYYGDKFWHQNNKRHREDGPAVEYANRDKRWYQNGKLHRLDGPAVEYADGGKDWWHNGECQVTSP